jgi:peroxiredoxin Q/BCP
MHFKGWFFMALEIGQPAPAFSLPITTDTTVSNTTYAGKWLVLYFYPKDNTPGCTTQAITFTEQKDAFAAEGAEILGVSKDSLKKHDNFTAKQNLKITLGSDETGTVCEDFGVWKEKKMYGKTFMGIERTTFLIDPEGIIRAIWPKVKVKDHIPAVLDTLKSFKAGA